jgi:hypothetical protein
MRRGKGSQASVISGQSSEVRHLLNSDYRLLTSDPCHGLHGR